MYPEICMLFTTEIMQLNRIGRMVRKKDVVVRLQEFVVSFPSVLVTQGLVFL